jgi:hypothetical protein
MSTLAKPSAPHREREGMLLACPPVFSYHVSIRRELEALGFDVTWWNDRASDSSFYKVGLRLLPDAVAEHSTSIFMRQLDSLDAASITRVLIVKGEGMSTRFLESLRRRLPHAQLSLYFWDSIDNAPRARTIAPMFDHVSTFDPVDAKRLDWKHRPLFARQESIAPAPAGEPARFDWCFIGTLHSDRHRIVERLRRSDPALRSYFFGFAPSRTLMAARHLADWSLWKAPRDTLSTRMMPAAEVAAISRASRAMLDVEHPRQRGLTMRTIETLLSHRKLITTNRHILDSDLFHPSRVHVISRERPEVPRTFLDTPFEPIDERVRSRYTLRSWIVELIGAPKAHA